jgi:hypothetical protein
MKWAADKVCCERVRAKVRTCTPGSNSMISLKQRQKTNGSRHDVFHDAQSSRHVALRGQCWSLVHCYAKCPWLVRSLIEPMRADESLLRRAEFFNVD